MQTFYSHGKLLLTGEYLVLDGALALALPTKYGQALTIEPNDEKLIKWKSIDNDGNVWFEAEFIISNNEILHFIQNDNILSKRLLDILNTAKQLNPNFLNNNKGFEVTSVLEFPRNWGLGSSSTLINNIANWSNVDAHKLLKLTFGGSGYDIACAQNNTAITYKILNNEPLISNIEFSPKFKEHLYFVYLNKKQNSREGIAAYKQQKVSNETITEISEITELITNCNTLNHFCFLIEKHESIISKTIKQKPIKELLFKDFNGTVKSLGAWGGDFILAASKENPGGYFKAKGYNTILTYNDMILN